MPKYILSDAKHLAAVKKQQYRHQLPPLALVVFAFLVNFALPNFNLRYPSLSMAIIAMVWFSYVGACFRIKQRIPVLEGDLLLSPLTGRVRHIKRSSDMNQLKVFKYAIDIVEIRSPHASSEWDGDSLKLNYKGHNLSFRFEAKELIRFPESSMEAGSLIGMLIGKGSYTINLPLDLSLPVKAGDISEAGLTILHESI